jgi:hypothetical protein
MLVVEVEQMKVVLVLVEQVVVELDKLVQQVQQVQQILVVEVEHTVTLQLVIQVELVELV